MGSGGMSTSGGPEELKGYGIGMGAPTPNDPHKYDEDCLGLNIWTKPQTGEKSKAVLMWIYGGGELTPDASSRDNDINQLSRPGRPTHRT
jgi:carboxylesterase type B